jgi:hypothetical protein
MYADDVLSLSSSQEGVEASLMGIYDWGLVNGMELGQNKCGIILWDGDHPRWIRPRVHQLLDLDDDNTVSNNDASTLESHLESHLATVYTMLEGGIPTVKKYKYLGVTVDSWLMTPHTVVLGECLMEFDFAFSQAYKGLQKLFALHPLLTNHFCPLALKVALVRNQVYGSMLYGVELIGFQKVHVEPM